MDPRTRLFGAGHWAMLSPSTKLHLILRVAALGVAAKNAGAVTVSKWGCHYVVTMEKMCHKRCFNEGTQLSKLVTELLKLCQIAVLLHSFFNEFLEKKNITAAPQYTTKTIGTVCSHRGYCTCN